MVKKGENIYKRKDGRWEGRFTKNRTTKGRIIYGYVYGKCYSEVKEKLSVKKAQYIFSSQQESNYSGTVEEWITYWLEKSIKESIKMSTYSNYRGKIEKHIIPHLGNIPLKKLKREDIETFIRHLASIQLSNSTIQNIVNLLKSAIKEAIRMEKIYHNPCKNVLLPSAQKASVQALPINNQRKLERAALQEEESSAIIIALYTGMRIGEISGLRWTDIEWNKNIIYVRRTISRIPSTTHVGKTELVIDLPKTKTSIRAIPLSKNLKKYLQIKRENATGSYIVNCKGTFTEPRIISYRFKKVLKNAGIAPISFHSLRHSFATRCIEKGVDIATLSKILGHASVKMTLDTYADSMWETRKSALNVLDKNLII
ncbi:tyrosine-type recombinase/integrase [Enterococcus ureasiticus]|uniref:Integrase n=1 Tax=Enterococcus ureasiticus TaxID=903984 RepID=A0A1E5GHD2_9ENTE|nr:site-specific integrase [Enterococcus ureasiticus]OEG12118.1 hypothetical protein BCR21_07730 [Enterococcus ureasiticus]